VDIVDLGSMTRLARLDIPAAGFGGAHGVADILAQD
jgi:hypothetical protein